MTQFLSEYTYTKEPLTDCERDDCRINVLSSFSTGVYFPPVYDKHGNNMNEAKQTTTQYKCETCGKEWTKVS